MSDNPISLKENLQTYSKEAEAAGATLVVVSKTRSVEEIKELYELGHRDFGENKVQELLEKETELPKDIRWHMIGHLQRNKVKYIAPFVNLIHSVDSLRLLNEINKQAEKAERKISCLLQVHIAEEESKFGLDAGEVSEILEKKKTDELSHVKILGLMGMATNTHNIAQVRKEFQLLFSQFKDIQKESGFENGADVLSMGMSNDYQIALAEGSNMIRIGSAIFGPRTY